LQFVNFIFFGKSQHFTSILMTLICESNRSQRQNTTESNTREHLCCKASLMHGRRTPITERAS